MQKNNYSEENIRSLDWKEHIRLRPGMYIGKLGDGSTQDDGIYVLLKEVVDNSIDEYTMGYGKQIKISVDSSKVIVNNNNQLQTLNLVDKNISDSISEAAMVGKIIVRDFGRGIPLGKVIDCVAKINTGGKYDSKAFQKSVGLNGVGTKAVNALSSYFKVQSFRDGKTKEVIFEKGHIIKNLPIRKAQEKDGTLIEFIPDSTIFKNFEFIDKYIEELVWNYVFLNTGLSLYFNNKRFYSKNGLLDLLARKTDEEALLYPIIHLQGEDIDVALTHNSQYGEEYYSFVNGQYTSSGGTHLTAFREALVKTVRDFYKKDFDAADIRRAIVSAISVRVQEPVFESQTKTKLGSQYVASQGPTIRSFVGEFIKKALDDYLHKNTNTAEFLLKRILQSERERKEIAGIKKIANERAKKASLHNKKLRDCRIHYNEQKDFSDETMIFITEGNSASGSITKSRNVNTQAVFSLRGKPLNCFGHTKRIVYENEEFNLLQHALNIEDSLEGLRYRKIVISTDADVDGMHIRLLILTYFLQYFPDLVRRGHLFILETPLFRVRNKKTTYYCYSTKEKEDSIQKIGINAEITRFKGLGEISPEEFKAFIGGNIKLQPVSLQKETHIKQLLTFYMGKNTPDRQKFIVDNLVVG